MQASAYVGRRTLPQDSAAGLWTQQNHFFCTAKNRKNINYQYKLSIIQCHSVRKNAYRCRFARLHSMLSSSITLFRWIRFSTGLFLISSFIEDHSKSFGWSWIINIPFAKFGQWASFVLLEEKVRLSQFGMHTNVNNKRGGNTSYFFSGNNTQNTK